MRLTAANILATTALAICGTAPLSAQELTEIEFKSNAAAKAVKDYLRWEERTIEEFQKEKEKELKTLRESLETALKKETKDGNLDEAVKIKQAIQSLDNQLGEEPGGVDGRMLGRWKVEYHDGGIRYHDIRQRGDSFQVTRWIQPDKRVEGQGTIALTKGETWFLWDRGRRRERLHLNGGRLYFEQWYLPKTKDTSGYPLLIGIGVKEE